MDDMIIYLPLWQNYMDSRSSWLEAFIVVGYECNQLILLTWSL